MKKINQYIKLNIISIISLLIVLQPIFDVIISFSINMNFVSIIFSSIRLITLCFLIYCLFVVNNYSFKKHIMGIFVIICSYLLLYSMYYKFNLSDIQPALRTFYFPTILFVLFLLKDYTKKFLDNKYLLVSLGIYCSIIIFGFITNTALNSYEGIKIGSAGYFNSANEVGNIIAILLPFVFNYVFNNINFKKIIYFILIIISIFILGTKTPFISLIICSIYYVIKSINKKNYLKVSLITIISIIVLAFSLNFLPIYKNISMHLSYLKVDNVQEIITDYKKIDHLVFGSRFQLAITDSNNFHNANLEQKIIGIGYSEHLKIAEIDISDILYRQGFLGAFIFFGIIFYCFNDKKIIKDKKYPIAIILINLIAVLVGHVYTSPAVSTFVAYIYCSSIKEENNEN